MSTTNTLDGMTTQQLEELQQRVAATIAAQKKAEQEKHDAEWRTLTTSDSCPYRFHKQTHVLEFQSVFDSQWRPSSFSKLLKYVTSECDNDRSLRVMGEIMVNIANAKDGK